MRATARSRRQACDGRLQLSLHSAVGTRWQRCTCAAFHPRICPCRTLRSKGAYVHTYMCVSMWVQGDHGRRQASPRCQLAGGLKPAGPAGEHGPRPKRACPPRGPAHVQVRAKELGERWAPPPKGSQERVPEQRPASREPAPPAGGGDEQRCKETRSSSRERERERDQGGDRDKRRGDGDGKGKRREREEVRRGWLLPACLSCGAGPGTRLGSIFHSAPNTCQQERQGVSCTACHVVTWPWSAPSLKPCAPRQLAAWQLAPLGMFCLAVPSLGAAPPQPALGGCGSVHTSASLARTASQEGGGRKRDGGKRARGSDSDGGGGGKGGREAPGPSWLLRNIKVRAARLPCIIKAWHCTSCCLTCT